MYLRTSQQPCHPTNLLSVIRYCRLMALIGFSLLCLSSALTILAQLTRTHFFMAASSTFTLAGLCLGSSLIILVAAVSDEFNSTSVSQVNIHITITHHAFIPLSPKLTIKIEMYFYYFEFIEL